MYKTKLVTGRPHQFTRFFYAFYLTMGSILEVSVRMFCPSCKKRRPSSKAPASKNICDYISNAQNKETICFFFFFVYLENTLNKHEKQSLQSNSRLRYPFLVSPFQVSITRSYYNGLCSVSLNARLCLTSTCGQNLLNARLSFYMHVIV